MLFFLTDPLHTPKKKAAAGPKTKRNRYAEFFFEYQVPGSKGASNCRYHTQNWTHLGPKKTDITGIACFESTSTAFSHSAEKRQEQVSPAYHAAARSLNADLSSQPGSPGTVGS